MEVEKKDGTFSTESGEHGKQNPPQGQDCGCEWTDARQCVSLSVSVSLTVSQRCARIKSGGFSRAHQVPSALGRQWFLPFLTNCPTKERMATWNSPCGLALDLRAVRHVSQEMRTLRPEQMEESGSPILV